MLAQTKRAVDSSAPYVALGILYAYLLYLSWTPDTLRAMFASKYWLPEVSQSISDTTLHSMITSILSTFLFSCAVDGDRQDVRQRDDRRLRLDPPPSRRPLRRKVSKFLIHVCSSVPMDDGCMCCKREEVVKMA